MVYFQVKKRKTKKNASARIARATREEIRRAEKRGRRAPKAKMVKVLRKNELK